MCHGLMRRGGGRVQPSGCCAAARAAAAAYTRSGVSASHLSRTQPQPDQQLELRCSSASRTHAAPHAVTHAVRNAVVGAERRPRAQLYEICEDRVMSLTGMRSCKTTKPDLARYIQMNNEVGS